MALTANDTRWLENHRTHLAERVTDDRSHVRSHSISNMPRGEPRRDDLVKVADRVVRLARRQFKEDGALMPRSGLANSVFANDRAAFSATSEALYQSAEMIAAKISTLRFVGHRRRERNPYDLTTFIDLATDDARHTDVTATGIMADVERGRMRALTTQRMVLSLHFYTPNELPKNRFARGEFGKRAPTGTILDRVAVKTCYGNLEEQNNYNLEHPMQSTEMTDVDLRDIVEATPSFATCAPALKTWLSVASDADVTCPAFVERTTKGDSVYIVLSEDRHGRDLLVAAQQKMGPNTISLVSQQGTSHIATKSMPLQDEESIQALREAYPETSTDITKFVTAAAANGMLTREEQRQLGVDKKRRRVIVPEEATPATDSLSL